MEQRSKKTPEAIFNDLAVKEWTCPKSGLRKELIDFKFVSMTKATEISKCLVNVSCVKHLGDRESEYLSKTEEFWIQLGTAKTPIDYYIEIFCQQMFIGETSKCFIKTKSNVEIEFIIKMVNIEFTKYLYELSVVEVYELAQQFKQNGVAMFKQYPKFAHEYFCRAAKLLISYQPFNVLNEKSDGVSPTSLVELFENLQTNIAACLIKEGRYEDVLYVTEFVNIDGKSVSDKAVFRRALALCNLSKFKEAKDLLEKNNYSKNKDMNNLYNRVITEWKRSDQCYSNMVKKMFS